MSNDPCFLDDRFPGAAHEPEAEPVPPDDAQRTDPTALRRGLHPVNVSHLVMGLVFLGIAGAWALRAGGVIDADRSAWVLPAILVLAGAAGLAASVARGLGRS